MSRMMNKQIPLPSNADILLQPDSRQVFASLTSI